MPVLRYLLWFHLCGFLRQQLSQLPRDVPGLPRHLGLLRGVLPTMSGPGDFDLDVRLTPMALSRRAAHEPPETDSQESCIPAAGGDSCGGWSCDATCASDTCDTCESCGGSCDGVTCRTCA